MFYVVYPDGLIFTCSKDKSQLAKSLLPHTISEEELLNSDKGRLLQIYNRNAEIPRRDFATQDEARERTASLLNTYFKFQEIPMAKREKNQTNENTDTTAGAEAGTENAAPKTPSSRTPKSAVIRLKVEANPKRAGSAAHERFAKYEDGMTVEAFLAAGGTMGDVNFDSGKGFITLEGVDAPETAEGEQAAA